MNSQFIYHNKVVISQLIIDDTWAFWHLTHHLPIRAILADSYLIWLEFS